MTAILDIRTERVNLFVTPMPSIKFRLNLTYCLIGDVVWRISRWLFQLNPTYSSGGDFSNSESLWPSDASHQVLAQSDMVWEELSFEEFQDGCHGAVLGHRNRTILAILNLYVTVMPPIKFWLYLTYCLVGDDLWRISRQPSWWPSWISEQNNFSNSESLCHCDASHQGLVQSDLWFGRRCCLKNFKMLPQCLPLSFSSTKLMVLEEMSKNLKS